MKRPLRKVVLVPLSLVAFILLFLTVEHFRGPWMLKRWKARMVASGELLEIDQLAPPALPLEQNGLPQLLWVAGQLSAFPFQLYPAAAKYTAPGTVIVISRLNDWPDSDSKRTNMTWVAIAEELAPLDAQVQEALEILADKRFNANLPYRSGFTMLMSHLPRLKSISQILSAAALHDLHQGQPDEAFAKLKGMLAVVEVAKNEPVLISQLVRIAIAHIAFAATWQAMQHEGWTDAQLAELQKAWADLAFLHNMERAMSMERAIAAVEYERFRTSDLPLSQLLDPSLAMGGGGAPLLSWKWFTDLLDDFPAAMRDQFYTPIWKFAWSYHDELHYSKLLQRMIASHREVISEKAGARLPGRMDRIEATAMSPYDRMRFLVSSTIYPALSKAFQRAWAAQVAAELATTAIAIKRFQLRRGELPQRLEDLVPEFMTRCPLDYMDGRPLKYCVDGDSFRLYSVGIDGKDDGGDGRHATGGNPNFHYGNDLLWPQPASEIEAAIWKDKRR